MSRLLGLRRQFRPDLLPVLWSQLLPKHTESPFDREAVFWPEGVLAVQPFVDVRLLFTKTARKSRLGTASALYRLQKGRIGWVMSVHTDNI